MADQAHIPTRQHWASLNAIHSELIHQFESGERDDLQAIEERIAAVEEAMLMSVAPDIDAVIMKIQFLWGGELHGEDDDSLTKLRILRELVSLTEGVAAREHDILAIYAARQAEKKRR